MSLSLDEVINLVALALLVISLGVIAWNGYRQKRNLESFLDTVNEIKEKDGK